ncbi:MarR family transcriptional regulator [Micromonospora sp. U21]|uniref:MarR family transcriptional regulator n=1 Tax=Micromonospora sp. U21 TaxID=2824899 RepID=UPI001B374EBD|nr:MarR family transcriptional regulator [Micromonospora sp. U21]MBQ0905464.1 MarR family transcriptional regulator [Micromonospora sp. U21]
MTDTSQETLPAHSTIKVLAALAELGVATAAAVADLAGLGYSTTTPKLRAWEESGQAERFRTDDGRTLWRLTAAGRAATATATSRESGGRTPADPVPPDVTVELTPDERSQDGDDLPAVELDDPGTSIDEHTEPAAVGTDPEAATVETTTPTPAETDGAGETPVGSTPGREPACSDTADAASAEARPAKTRRVGGSLRGAILDILEAHPDRQYKTGELCKLIDTANEGTGAAKASPGAVVNAATKLVAAGTAMQTVERPATFQLAPASAGR